MCLCSSVLLISQLSARTPNGCEDRVAVHHGLSTVKVKSFASGARESSPDLFGTSGEARPKSPQLAWAAHCNVPSICCWWLEALVLQAALYRKEDPSAQHPVATPHRAESQEGPLLERAQWWPHTMVCPLRSQESTRSSTIICPLWMWRSP